MVEEATKKSSMKTILTVGAIAVLGAGLVIAGAGLHKANLKNSDLAKSLEDNQGEISELNSKLSAKEITIEQYNSSMNALGVKVDDLAKQVESDKQIIEDYKVELEKLKASEEATSIDSITHEYYSIDDEELNFHDTIDADSDDLSKLGSYEVELDDDQYDVDETVSFSGALFSNAKDFDGETMYTLEDGDVVYNVEFSDDMNEIYADLDEDEDDTELSFSFLGQSMSISDWECTGTCSVDMNIDVEQIMNPGQIISGVTLVKVGDENAVISYEGETFIVKEDKNKDLGDIDVTIVGLYNSDEDSEDMAVVKIGSDLDSTIEDGDEYEADDRFDWQITSNSIGLVLNDDYDEEDTALKESESFTLPSEFLKLSFSLDDVDTYDLSVEPETSDLYKVEGKLRYKDDGSYETTHKVYYSTLTESFYSDNDASKVISGEIKFEGSNRVLTVGDLALDYASHIDDDEDVYKYEVTTGNTLVGTIIKNLDEDSHSYDIVVPDEEVEVTFKLQ